MCLGSYRSQAVIAQWFSPIERLCRKIVATTGTGCWTFPGTRSLRGGDRASDAPSNGHLTLSHGNGRVRPIDARLKMLLGQGPYPPRKVLSQDCPDHPQILPHVPGRDRPLRQEINHPTHVIGEDGAVVKLDGGGKEMQVISGVRQAVARRIGETRLSP